MGLTLLERCFWDISLLDEISLKQGKNPSAPDGYLERELDEALAYWNRGRPQSLPATHEFCVGAGC